MWNNAVRAVIVASVHDVDLRGGTGLPDHADVITFIHPVVQLLPVNVFGHGFQPRESLLQAVDVLRAENYVKERKRPAQTLCGRCVLREAADDGDAEGRIALFEFFEGADVSNNALLGALPDRAGI